MAHPDVTVLLRADVRPFIDAARRLQAQMDAVRRITANARPGLARLREVVRQLQQRNGKPSRSSGPRPLCIDGHAYARKRRARRR